MDRTPPSPEEWRRFTADRGHSDAQSVNDHARAAPQALILVNGGAATATLALATSNTSMRGDILLSLGLALYVLGVIVALYNIRILTDVGYRVLVYWDSFNNTDVVLAPNHQSETNEIRKRGESYFIIGVVCFVFGSMMLAGSILSKPNTPTISSEAIIKEKPADSSAARR